MVLCKRIIRYHEGIIHFSNSLTALTIYKLLWKTEQYHPPGEQNIDYRTPQHVIYILVYDNENLFIYLQNATGFLCSFKFVPHHPGFAYW